ncbi:hypothetical protein HOP60_09270 [Halomonas daqingensis]|uniref:Transposase IS204/IS1001/IS1096/IS1165 DDE domain-containing protein n=1 Tax=Billgrantia desiderata TaxID=52021 RepID=A0ABS9B406_9GAMM|nr:hypothetical protein [Halomonas desiderata]MCE8046923.1 hypothetical protein [Halomonas desiderata]
MRGARAGWQEWIQLAKASDIRPIVTVAEQVEEKLWGILNAMRLRACNRLAEALNGKIRRRGPRASASWMRCCGWSGSWQALARGVGRWSSRAPAKNPLSEQPTQIASPGSSLAMATAERPHPRERRGQCVGHSRANPGSSR